MTDTNVSPPIETEVPINPDPPSSPTPITNAPPEKPEGPPPSRREAIQAAFDRATRAQDAKEKGTHTPAQTRVKAAQTDAKPADAKRGHNQPPEMTPDEKLDLKKRPSDQPRERGERGQFVARAQTDQPKDTVEAEEKSSIRTLPENAPHRDPPARMAEHAKRDWAAAPESVRGEVHRMHQEFSNAYNQLKPVYDAFQPIVRFHQMAQQHGTTLERALHNYTSMEAKLRSDPVAGLDVIVNNLGLKAPDGQPIGLRDIAYHVLSQTQDQLRQLQIGNQQSATGQHIGALHQEIQGLKSALHQMHTQQQFTYTRSQVDQFADSHPRFDELGTLIEKELQLGFDLETAYRRAGLLKPATRAAQTGTPAAQTRAPADRSISGSPGGVNGSNPSPRRNEKPVGRREAISNAIRRVNSGA